tara:strand:- start:1227 stop:2258 length:1032 start_codon:yes stop_codon:yes gene_type:complete
MIKSNQFTIGGLFSGVGGIELGFQQAGFETVWANEFDRYSSKTYRSNHGNNLIEEDVHLLQGKELEPIDVLTAGFPCQAFSVAGYRKGFRDPRGNLFFEIARLVEELETPPKAIMLENVKGLSNHDKGKTAEVIKDTLRVLGYSVFWNILNTSELTNVPQNRERTIIVGFRDEADWQDSKDIEFPLASTNFDAIFPPKSKKRNRSIRELLETDVDEKYYYGPEKYMYKELKAVMKNPETAYQWRRKYVRENQNNEMFTLTANMGTGGHNVPLIIDDKGFRKLTPRECFNFQGFPKSFKLPSDVADGQLYKQAGNAVTVPLMKLIASKIKIALESKYSTSLSRV